MLEKIKRWARELKAQLLTLWFCRFHPDTPLAAKLLAGFAVAYAFSPIDLIPDFIPVLGYLDDPVIVPIGIYLTSRLILPHMLADARLYWLWILVAELEGRPVGKAAPANLFPDVAAEVWGVLYRITPHQLVQLDATEGMRYRHVLADAEDKEGRPMRAVSCIAAGKETTAIRRCVT